MYVNLMNRLDPWREFSTLQREMNRLFDNFGSSERRAFPAVNVWSNADKAVVTAEIPGMEKNDLTLTVVGSDLLIEGGRKAEPLQEGETYHRQERGVGAFKRMVSLPFPVDDTQINANLKNGVLTITLPRAEEDKPRKIEIA